MLYLQSLKIYITTFLLEVFLVIILVDLSSASSVPEYTDSCSDSSEISLSEVEEGGNSHDRKPGDNFRQQQWFAHWLWIKWFNVLCYRNRVSCWHLDDSKPIRPVLDLPNSSFLPSLEKHSNLHADYIILVLRILVKHCNYFKKFQDLFQVISLTNSARRWEKKLH